MTAKLVPEKQLSDGAVVFTNEQTAGRGQRGNSWEASPGENLTFSIYLKTHFLDIADQFYLNIITSLGVCEFLGGYIQEEIKVKWPNDIYYRDQKIGGILIENSIRKGGIDYSIVGIGLNINQSLFQAPNATSMGIICNQNFNLESLLQELLQTFESQFLKLKRGNYQSLLDSYLAKLYWMDESRIFMTNGQFFEGTICGIDEIGKLQIQTSEGLRSFDIKEVSFVK